MILQALYNYFETLASQDRIAKPGWGKMKVSWAVDLNDDGSVVEILCLKVQNEGEKKPSPRTLIVPAPVKRTSAVSANFLCDNAAYVLGISGKGKPDYIRKCFQDAARFHQECLENVSSPAAKAVCSFFQSWDPDAALTNPLLADAMNGLLSGENLVFMYMGAFVQDFPEIRAAWQAYYDEDEAGEPMRCLITGRETVPARIHPPIKGVQGAQATGAALVSFNGDAYESYNREQNLNAPVSPYAAFAYTTALNELLADRKHVRHFGDATVVYWAEDASTICQNIFGDELDGGGETVSNQDLHQIMTDLSNGNSVDIGGIPLHPENRFYVLGLSPNAARISVRFFLQRTFGEFAAHLSEHYDRIRIISDGRNNYEDIPLWVLLRETVNPKANDKTPSPQMSGNTLSAVLSGGRYPQTLYDQTMLRIRAERDITRGKAAIIKACLLRNTEDPNLKEVSTVALNENSSFVPYVLGRLFSLLENVQDRATGASTVKDRYFNSACSTPAAVFPLLLRLKNSHMKVLMREKPDVGIALEKRIGELMFRLGDGFPKTLTLQEQGAFILGYYHQRQDGFEKAKAYKAAGVTNAEN